MNILQLIVDYPPPLTGGLPRQVRGLSQVLATRHLVGVAASGPARLDGPVRVFGTDPLPAVLPMTDLTHLARVNLGLVKALVEAALAETWDLIHAHDWMVAPAAAVAHHALGIPIVASIHTDAGSTNVGSPENRLRRLEWEASLARVSSLLLAVSLPVRDSLTERYPQTDVRYLPNGVDTDSFTNATAERDVTRLLYVGRLVPYKGCQDALEAVARLRHAWPNLRLDIVGDGFSRTDLETQAVHLGLQDIVAFRGWEDGETLTDAYGAATIVVVPSREEAFGLVAIEAMATGTPVVATSIPAFESYISHGQTGMLANAADPADLARHIDALLRDPLLRTTIARNAQQDVVPKHDWHRVVETVESAYRDVIAFRALP